MPDGPQTIVATVRDAAGHVGVGTRTVNLQNGVLAGGRNRATIGDRANAVRPTADERSAQAEAKRAIEYAVRSISGTLPSICAATFLAL